ncbi:AfsR/SARP family transcriptional regulator [Streptomyces sp. SudanB182_2057]|uniref:AfsR/SARP family transcriptional regulator n=1 Tax=Streptomyces sp. SudanB182_2057 TaxID=3035281 RepID=UPI003F54C4A7
MVKFRILGPVGAWFGNVEIQLGGAKQRTILAALLLADGWVVSDVDLSEILWGKNPPSTYQAQIYTYASRLRGHLGEESRIVRRGQGYSLERGDAYFDLQKFEEFSRAGNTAAQEGHTGRAAEKFRAALDLWTGPTLTAVTERLVDNERSRIELARTDVLERRIDADLLLGRHQALIGELSQLVSVHPLRESFRAKLMIALYRSDRQGEAFAVYREGRSLLRDQLGVDPGPALRNAYQEILTDDLPRALPSSSGLLAGRSG